MENSINQKKSSDSIAKDPVCGMDVDINKAPARSEYQGRIYYFCAPGCKTQFDKDPAKYVTEQSQSSNSGHRSGHGCCLHYNQKLIPK
ncbi:MAG: YHS domain-containing protein [Actinobacteria bacterium]|nr:YHS domain-containing protein [Actinomycetota bacterium]